MLATKITEKNNKELKAVVSCDFFNRIDDKVASKEILIDLKISKNLCSSFSLLTEPSAA